MHKSLGVAAVALSLVGLLPIASHAGRLAWAGKVDNVSIVRIHRRSVSVQVVTGKGVKEQSYFVTGLLGPHVRYVHLRGVRGRGSVRVIQQPGPFNGDTAAVRIADPQPGRGPYHFTLAW